MSGTSGVSYTLWETFLEHLAPDEIGDVLQCFHYLHESRLSRDPA